MAVFSLSCLLQVAGWMMSHVVTSSNSYSDWFYTYLNSQQSQYYPPPFNFTPQISSQLHHLLHFHAAHPYAPLPALGITPDHGTAPSVTGLSQFILGIISYQPLTFPLRLALSSSAPEQRSTACHNWGRYRSPMAAILQCFPLHPHPFSSSHPSVFLCVLSLTKNLLPGLSWEKAPDLCLTDSFPVLF